jgi:hypothetical protein
MCVSQGKLSLAGTPVFEKDKNTLILFFHLRRAIQSTYKVLFDGVTNNGCEELLMGSE